MPYKRWDPLQDLLSLHQDLLNERGEAGLADQARSAWSPAIDIYETEKAFVLKAEIPGVDPDKIKIEYRDRTLILAGERPPQAGDKNRRYHHVERSYGPFERRFALPRVVSSEQIEANYENGVIEIIAPKISEDQPKKIKVTC